LNNFSSSSDIQQNISRAITDKVSPALRIEAVYALSISCFMCTTEDQMKWDLLELLGSIIMGTYDCNDDDNDDDGDDDANEDGAAGLMVAAIECWAFILTFFSPSTIVPMFYDPQSILYDHLRVLMSMVQRGEDSVVRSMACEAFALLVEYKYAIAQSSWSYESESASSPIGGLIPKLQVKTKTTSIYRYM
jgi:hypothetical protein